MTIISTLKTLAAANNFTLYYDRHIRLWALTDNSGNKSAYYFTKYLLTNTTVEQFERYHFG